LAEPTANGRTFGKARSTFNEHIQNVFKEGELKAERVMRKFGNPEFALKPTNFYNLDVVISVGDRVKSLRGTHSPVEPLELLGEQQSRRCCMRNQGGLRRGEGGGW